MADWDKTPMEQRIREAIIKGIVERNDARVFLGFSNVRVFLDDAIRAKLIDEKLQLTDAGWLLYKEKACKRPRTKWFYWE